MYRTKKGLEIDLVQILSDKRDKEYVSVFLISPEGLNFGKCNGGWGI